MGQLQLFEYSHHRVPEGEETEQEIGNIFENIMKKDGGEIGGNRVHFPLAPVKHLADLRNRANSQWYSSICEDQRPKIEDIERSDGKKSA